MTCEECGNDDAAEGYRVCTDCLERLGHAGDAYALTLAGPTGDSAALTPVPR